MPRRTQSNSNELIRSYVPGDHKKNISRKKWDTFDIDIFNVHSEISSCAIPPINSHIFCYTSPEDFVLGSKRYRARVHVSGERVFEGNTKNDHCFLTPRLHDVHWDACSIDKNKVYKKTFLVILNEQLEKIALENFKVDPDLIEIIPNYGFRDAYLANAANALAKTDRTENKENRVYVETLTQSFNTHLMHHFTNRKLNKEQIKSAISSVGLRRINHFIKNNISEEISLDDLAQVAGMSPYYFIRQFQQTTGMPPHQYLIYERMRMAKNLLSKTNLSILDIALEIGYSSSSSFSYAFRKAFGVTPSFYRRDLKY